VECVSPLPSGSPWWRRLYSPCLPGAAVGMGFGWVDGWVWVERRDVQAQSRAATGGKIKPVLLSAEVFARPPVGAAVEPVHSTVRHHITSHIYWHFCSVF
jgi:hypothetical protein